MDEIKTVCPKCGQKVSGPKDLEGQFVDCPFCESSFQFKKTKRNFFTSINSKPKEGIWNKNYGCGHGIFIFLIFIGLIGYWAPDREENSGSETQQSQTQQPTQEGETTPIGNMTYTVLRSWWSNHVDGERPNSNFLLIEMSVQNVSNEPNSIQKIQLLDQFGNTHDSSILTYRLDSYIRRNDLNPGVTKNGIIVFDVPKDRNYSMKIRTDVWESEFGYILLNPK